MKDGKVVALDYGRSELLSILHDKVEDYGGIKELRTSLGSLGVLTWSFGAVFSRSEQSFERWLHCFTHRKNEEHMMIGDRLRDLREAKRLSQGDIEDPLSTPLNNA